MSNSRVDLGFLEKTEKHLLRSNYFPSKVGGKPSWLDLKLLPTSERLKCSKCTKPMIFLCQVYAPIDDKPECFHRTIFLFVCRSEECCIRNENKNLIAVRSQLPRKNDYYSFEPPKENDTTDFNLEKYVKICNLCGCSADKHCSKCKIASYCSREHQIFDWKAGHKAICGSSTSTNKQTDKSILFEEFELIIEEETNEDNTTDETPEEAEKRRLKEYEELKSKGELGTMQDCPDQELESHVAGTDDDKTFSRFRKKIAEHPDQVLRYNRGGEPIWIAKEPIPDNIPNCENCGADRQFEFQILPQLLYQLHENTIDWGVLCVFTCKNNCSSENSYITEFVFKQDVALSNL